MANITFKGTPVKTVGTLPQKGSKAPDFTLVAQDLKEIPLNKYNGKIKILNVVPSLDTEVCSTTAKRFHAELKDKPDIVFINISMDLPFAQARFCKEAGMKAEETLSCFRSTFPKDYGVLMLDGPLKGLCSRAVLLLDKENKVLYTEQVPEITKEPDYGKVFQNL